MDKDSGKINAQPSRSRSSPSVKIMGHFISTRWMFTRTQATRNTEYFSAITSGCFEETSMSSS